MASTYRTAKKKLRNILQARHAFYKRFQRENETFTSFCQDLKHLVKFCNFKEFEESMLRDRLIFGLTDPKLRDEIIEYGGDPKLEHIIGVCEFLERKQHRHFQRGLDAITMGSGLDMFGSETSETSDFVQISHESMADLNANDTMVSVEVELANHLMTNITHEDSSFDGSDQMIFSRLRNVQIDEDSHMREETDHSIKDRKDDKGEKEKKDCRRSGCVRVKKELKSIHDKLKKYKTRNETLFDLNLKLQLRLNRLESSESSASGNSNRLSRLEGFLEGRNYGLPDNTVSVKVGDAEITLQQLKQIHSGVSPGTKKDSEFIRHLANLLWSENELILRTTRRNCNLKLRECTPEKKDFLAKQLHLRAENEGYCGPILDKRTKAATIRKILKTHIDRKEKKLKRKQQKTLMQPQSENHQETSEE